MLCRKRFSATDGEWVTTREQKIITVDRLGRTVFLSGIALPFRFLTNKFKKGYPFTMKKVAVIMGSDSDLPVVEKAISTLAEYGVPYEVHVFSAHRTPEEARVFSSSARQNGFGAIIAAAGMAAHLAGAIAANTTLPVIGIPVKSKYLDGIDALLSTVQMPTGIPVATVAIDGAGNAALLAIQMLAIEDAALAAKLDEKRAKDAAAVLEKDKALAAKLAGN
jgi:5-(carboxyamino)imidazole ribonucleotide mutase